MEETAPQQQPESGAGAIVASVIVVLVIIAGAFYLFDRVQEKRQQAVPDQTDAALEVLITDDAAGTIELTTEVVAPTATDEPSSQQ
jgi:uncharacterized protein HemX